MPSSLTDFANQSALDLNVMDSGGGLSAQQYLDILAKANRIIDNWSAEQIMIPWATTTTVPLTVNTIAYQVGFAQAWSFLFPPLRIVSAIHSYTNIQNALRTPVKVVDPVEWASIPDRGAPGNLIKYLFYQRGARQSANATALISPAPLQIGSLDLVTWDPLVQFTNVGTAITFPPGYELAFQLELTIQIAPMFDTQPSQDLMDRRNEAMNTLRKLNADLWGPESLGREQEAVKATE